MKKLFISYRSTDKEIIKAIEETKDSVFEGFHVTFTNEEGSLPEGGARGEGIRGLLQEADVMIAFITDAYMRSVICLSEISAFWAMGKPVLPIVFNGQEGKDYLNELFGYEIIHIDASSDDRKERENNLINGLMRKTGELKLSEARAQLAIKWVEHPPSNPDGGELNDKNAFVGGIAMYRQWMHYMINNGLISARDGFPDRDTIARKFRDKDEVYIIGTTNKGFIDNNVQMLTELITHADVYILHAGAQTSFLLDVSQIEHEKGENESYSVWNDRVREDQERLNAEIRSVVTNMKKVIGDAGNRNGHHVYIGSVSTLVRQTMILGVKEETSNNPAILWGWLNTTIPPKRASETLGMEIESDVEGGFASDLYAHARGLVRIAQTRGTLREITAGGDIIAETQVQAEIDPYKIEWEEYQEAARARMKIKTEANGAWDLIEIAAQHPLENGEVPGEAFRQRLDHGIEIYNRLKRKGRECRLFIPGSRHKGDRISLSEAGKDYLLEKGISPSDILFEGNTGEFIRNWGIYNGADECFVAARVFFSDDEYRDLYCICSANQVPRKKLFYIRNGVIPKIYCVPDDSFHDDLDEFFDKIPSVLYVDQDWQSEDSLFASRSRKERMPGYVSERQKYSVVWCRT